MKGNLFLLIIFGLVFSLSLAINFNKESRFAMATTQNIYEFPFTTIAGEKQSFSQFEGRVLLIVNTASKCGFTKQYSGLEALFQEYKERGLTVIGFPSNDFGNQEPGTNEEIATFCTGNFGVTFPMAERVVVKGGDKTPVYQFLTSTANPAGEVDWNFEKFLINREGKVVGRFKSAVTPESEEIRKAIETAL
jgi:glutathione peroxidase